MDYQEAEQLLNNGFRIGFIKPTDHDDYLGWILISKFKTNRRIIEVISEEENPTLIQEERKRELQPYMVLHIELNRGVHEEGGYETEADYRQKERYWFTSLEEVDEHLKENGKNLCEAKEARTLDAP